MNWLIGLLGVVLVASLVFNVRLSGEIKRLRTSLQKMRESRPPKSQKIELQNKLDKWFLEEKLKLSTKLAEEEKNIHTKLRNYQTAEYIEIEEQINEMREKRISELKYAFELEKNNRLNDLGKLAEKLAAEEETMRGETENFKKWVEVLQQQTNEWREKYAAAVRNYEELYKMENQENIHRIKFDVAEQLELEELAKAIAKLRNPMPFHKAVYEIYIAAKINELVLRVVGRGRVTGIYKITHVKTGMCYVGQSVDIGNRWKQHARRGTGAVEMTQNRLYPAMMELGIENFIWEVVETTDDRTKLGEMENYWQEFYKAKDFGYSIK